MANNESVSIPNHLTEKLKQKPNSNLRRETVQSLERYFEILKVGIREVKKTFTGNELMLLADIANGTSFEPFGIILENNGLLMQLEDTEEFYGQSYYEKHETDGTELKAKLANLSKVGQIALIEVIEVFWQSDNKYTTLLECLKDLK